MTPSKPRRAPRKAAVPKIPLPPIAAPEPSLEPMATDWELASLVLFAEDAFYTARDGVVLPDPRLAPRWQVVGTVTAVDAPVRVGKYKIGAQKRFYGWRLRSRGGEQVLALRGTASCAEWFIDALFSPRTAHPVSGRVESGFWSVYDSMRIDGRPITSIAKEGPITVAGHSLGAAMATFASLELAQAGAKVRGVFIASPHPGDSTFCKAFGQAVPDHVMYRNKADYVPRLPFWFGYSDVPNVTTLSAAKAGITITGKVAQHHIVSYLALMNRAAFKAFKPLACDQKFLNCIRT